MTATDDFTSLTGGFRSELLVHCYRMLGSADEAEDVVQETYLRAWRGYAGFEGRASVRTWLYRIATNACLTAIERRGRRPAAVRGRRAGRGPAGAGRGRPRRALAAAGARGWLGETPDDPAAVAAARAGTRLALIAAWQYLPARQRAILILRDVLDWPAAEVADLLGTSTTAVNSGLRRARTLAARALPAEDDVAEPAGERERALLDRFAAAFEEADVTALAALLRDDVVLEMPPVPSWFTGRAAVLTFVAANVLTTRGRFRLQPGLSQRPAGVRQLRARPGRGVPGARGAGPDGHPGRDRAAGRLPRPRPVPALPPAAAAGRSGRGRGGESGAPHWSIWVAGRTTRPRTLWGQLMTSTQITVRPALVTGASRGFGRAIATALTGAGVPVVGVARDRAALDGLRAELGGSFTPVAADAADPVVAGQLIDAYRPGLLVLNAGAAPLARPIHQHTWETFSRNWEVDVRQVFHWTREALLAPLDPGSLVITLSSGAAVRGSPLSGGYAGAKATVRFITAYAAAEAERDGLGIRFVSLLPQLTPVTGLGAAAVAGYAAREGIEGGGVH